MHPQTLSWWWGVLPPSTEEAWEAPLWSPKSSTEASQRVGIYHYLSHPINVKILILTVLQQSGAEVPRAKARNLASLQLCSYFQRSKKWGTQFISLMQLKHSWITAGHQHPTDIWVLGFQFRNWFTSVYITSGRLLETQLHGSFYSTPKNWAPTGTTTSNSPFPGYLMWMSYQANWNLSFSINSSFALSWRWDTYTSLWCPLLEPDIQELDLADPWLTPRALSYT